MRLSVRVAALDCGTNSLRLLVADVGGLEPVEVTRRMEVVRLGEGVDRTGRLSTAALGRTFGVLRAYREDLHRMAVDRVRMVATSATRDAANRDEFVAGVRGILGVDPEVLTGDEEAALSFAGATSALRQRPDVAAPYLVVDIGGGSTEFVLGGDRPEAAVSVDVGCVRLTERHLHADPPTPEQVAAAGRDVAAALARAGEVVPLDRAATLLGLAGTVTTIAALGLGLTRYDARRIHLARVDAAAVRSVTDRLLAMTHDERAALPVMHPGRADVIGAGALLLRAVLDATGLDSLVASEHDILDGIALALAG